MVFKLDKINRRILFELDKNARIADTQLAKRVGRSPEAVRYRIRALLQAGVITGFRTWIDPARLGYSSAKMYLSLANLPELRKAFVSHVTQDKRLFWLGIAEGAWNAGLTYFVQSPREFFELKNDLFSRFKGLILDSRTGTLVDVNICDKTFLVPEQTEWKTLFGEHRHEVLDQIEKSILAALVRDARASVVELARELGTSVDIVRARMRKLEERKIIVRYAAVIDYGCVGYALYKTFLFFKSLSKRDEAQLMEYVRQQPNIVHLVKQISPWDIELESLCGTYAEYQALINALTRQFAHAINKVETAIISEDYVFPSKRLLVE